MAAVSLLCLAFPLRAQPDPDSVTAHNQRLLSQVGDSLRVVLSANWEFNRDLKQAGPETVLARAAALRARCHAAGVVVRRAESGIIDRGRGRVPLARVRQALKRVEVALGEECELAFGERGAGDRADTLRAWGPYRGQRLEKVIADYEEAAREFAEANGIKLDP